MATNPINWAKDLRQYFSEVVGEYRKISWPAQNEALAGSISVIVVVAVVGGDRGGGGGPRRNRRRRDRHKLRIDS